MHEIRGSINRIDDECWFVGQSLCPTCSGGFFAYESEVGVGLADYGEDFGFDGLVGLRY